MQKRVRPGGHTLKFGGNGYTARGGGFRNRGNMGTKKKLLIKPFKVQPKAPHEFEERALANLKQAVAAVYKKEGVQQSLEELYRSVENLCIHKRANDLFDRLREQCKQHITTTIQTLSALTKERDPVQFLRELDCVWNDHCQEMLTIRGIYLYLDRTHVIHNTEVKSIWDMGVSFFRVQFLEHKRVRECATQGALILVQRQRLGENVDGSRIKSHVRMTVTLDLYQSSFEERFMDATTHFYRAEAARCIQDQSLSDYLALVKRRLEEEEERIESYLNHTSRIRLMTLVRHHLIAAHIANLLTKAFTDPIPSKADLALIYSFFESVEALAQLQRAFGEYTKRTGLRIIEQGVGTPGKGNEMVQQLLELQTNVNELVGGAFCNNTMFTSAVQHAFECFINEKNDKPAELIAKFVNWKLQSGSKGSSEEELDRLLQQIMCLFRFVNDKDMFQAFYKKDLAKRLLLNKSASEQNELAMIAKLKAECGPSFTRKLEDMFKDMKLSVDIMSDYQASVRTNTSFELNVQLLTTSSWPSYPETPMNLPKHVEAAQESLRVYYLSKNSSKKLSWANQLGTCVLRANFKKGRKELAVSAGQATVLMLFNEKPTSPLSFAQIKDLSGIEEDNLKRILASLACSKTVNPLLKKPSKSRVVSTTDMFKVNQGLTHKLIRIKVNQIQARETTAERKDTTRRVIVDRQYATDAAIVRIMKSKKKLANNLLLSEVVSQMDKKFLPKFPEIKKRIASLLEREYITRDPDNPQMYIYQA